MDGDYHVYDDTMGMMIKRITMLTNINDDKDYSKDKGTVILQLLRLL